MPISRLDKTSIVINLANLTPNFLLNLEKKYVFRKTGNNIKYDPDYQGDCEQKKARTDHVLNIEKINELIMLNNLNAILAEIKQEESEEDETKAQNTATDTTKTDSAPESADHDAQGLGWPATDQNKHHVCRFFWNFLFFSRRLLPFCRFFVDFLSPNLGF